uniref:Microtubule-actin cross-linking factor 1 n=1 Tax=Syphacia muris TaxID=451379 RepID=A0A0N5ADM7_9BILA
PGPKDDPDIKFKKSKKIKSPEDELDSKNESLPNLPGTSESTLPVGDENKPSTPTKKKRTPKRGKAKPVAKKPSWEPPPPLPQEKYDFPPDEKRLCDILKEEKIPPTKRYAKKPRKFDVLIPCKIPWEFWPCIQSQEGMRAFGCQRDPYIKVDHGAKKLVQGEVHSETIIPLLSQAKSVPKDGMLPFGAYRRNISTVIDNHDFDDSKIKLCEQYIPLVNKGSRNWIDNDVTIGSIRNQTLNVRYSEKLTSGVQLESHTFIGRQFAATSEVAGSNIIGKQRGTIIRDERGETISKFDPASEQIVPRLFSIQSINLKGGSDFGSFRPLISESDST